MKNKNKEILDDITENREYLQKQIITYLGNKRLLLSEIEQELAKIQKKLNGEKLVCLDLFSGSGIVARLMKKYAKKVIANDLESYSKIINECYLSNADEFDEEIYIELQNRIRKHIHSTPQKQIFSRNYAPVDEMNIQEGERVFFTTRNAKYIDNILNAIEQLEHEKNQHISAYKKYFLAPLLSEISIKTNTSGVFKGFYKNTETGIGQFGGNGECSLKRIKGNIKLESPVFSNFSCEYEVYQKNANELVRELTAVDVTYIDPPYNQHPYGSNYFMLNIATNYELPSSISKVSGIPNEWNRSQYNKKIKSYDEIQELLKSINSKYVIMSYSSDAFIPIERLKELLDGFDLRGSVEVKEIPYNTFRGSRNLSKRNSHIKEYLFIIQMKHMTKDMVT